MAKPFIKADDVNKWVSAMDRLLVTEEKETAEAIRDIGKTLGAAVRDRVFPAKNLNIQDSVTPRSLSGRKPVRTTYLPRAVEVSLSEYYGNARAIPVYETLKSLGVNTERESLQVDLSGQRSEARTEVDFAEAPRLEEWARQGGSAPDTWQYHEHAKMLPVEALQRLAMSPAIRASEGEIMARFDEVQQRFLKAASD